MTPLLLLLPLAALQQADDAAADPARAAWERLQQGFETAAAIGFRAEGEYLCAAGLEAGSALATIEVAVSVARPGFGEVHVAARAAGAEAGVDASAFGTEEGIWSLAHGEGRAYACGGSWSDSTELDDFVFLGPAWSGWCARRGDPDVVSFVPAHAEHPGLTGLRVRWNARDGEGHRSAIWWLDRDGGLHSADVRLDAETVLHWSFRDFVTETECDPLAFAATLPEGFVRDGFGLAEASARGEVGLTGEAAEIAPPCEPTAIEQIVAESLEPVLCGEARQAEAGNGAPVVEPAVQEPAVVEPVIEEPTVEPAVVEPANETPAVEEPPIEEPAVEEPVADEPVQDQPVVEDPA